MEFKQYRRKNISEMREVTQNDIDRYKACTGNEKIPAFMEWNISISAADLANGSPKIGDFIARNPKNHSDQWLVAKDYASENLEEIKSHEL